jgi:hypothetical protein
MPQVTLQDILNSLPEDQRDEYLAHVRRQANLARRPSGFGQGASQLARGAGHGFANSLYGLATLPVALTNMVGLTDADFARKNLFGPGSLLEDPEAADGGAMYNLGNFAGFLGSLPAALPLGPAAASTGVRAALAGAKGLAKGALPIAGHAGRLTTGAQRGALALRKAARIPDNFRLAPTNLLSKSAGGAAEFAALNFLTHPASVEDRLVAAQHGIGPGAVLGAAGRLRGFMMKNGTMVRGIRAEQELLKHGSLGAMMEKGLLKLNDFGLPIIERKTPYVLASAARAVRRPPCEALPTCPDARTSRPARPHAARSTASPRRTLPAARTPPACTP